MLLLLDCLKMFASGNISGETRGQAGAAAGQHGAASQPAEMRPLPSSSPQRLFSSLTGAAGHARMMRPAALAAAAALCLAALAAAQPAGSNPGLPPSATATGLAPQKITDLAGRLHFAESQMLSRVRLGQAQRLPSGLMVGQGVQGSGGRALAAARAVRTPLTSCSCAHLLLPFAAPCACSARHAAPVQLQRHRPVSRAGHSMRMTVMPLGR